MRGAPKLLSITTLRPLGPRVTFTASARVSTPLRMRSRASRLNLTSLAAIYASFRFRRKLRNFTLKSGFRRIGGTGSGDDAENVRFLHDQQLFAVDLDFGARPFAQQAAVEIGRATGRERGCQVGTVSVVGASLKKKN